MPQSTLQLSTQHSALSTPLHRALRDIDAAISRHQAAIDQLRARRGELLTRADRRLALADPSSVDPILSELDPSPQPLASPSELGTRNSELSLEDPERFDGTY